MIIKDSYCNYRNCYLKGLQKNHTDVLLSVIFTVSGRNRKEYLQKQENTTINLQILTNYSRHSKIYLIPSLPFCTLLFFHLEIKPFCLVGPFKNHRRCYNRDKNVAFFLTQTIQKYTSKVSCNT